MNAPALALVLVPLMGCTIDPAAPLFETPMPRATVLPSEAPEKTADGFANILADPVTVGGLKRDPPDIASAERATALRGERAAAAARAADTPSFAGSLAAQGRDHVAEAKAEIMRSARPQTGAPTALPEPEQGASPTDTDANKETTGQPLDPSAPQPRTVGVPPSADTSVAPPQ